MKKVAIVLILSILAFTSATKVQAESQVIPSFSSCQSPTGQVVVSYTSGTHGIVGREATFQGSDTVYALNSTQVLQCFCADSNDGVQTKWWRIDELSQSEIEYYEHQGWIYVPNGSLWGLAHAPYLAYNSNYSCAGVGGGNSSGSSNSSSSNNSDNGVGGQILAATTSIPQVLGLAETGNQQWWIVGLIAAVIIFNITIIRAIRKGW